MGLPEARRLGGRCHCGGVAYAVADDLVSAAYCHCSNCRRTTGSAFKPFARIERAKLELTTGAENLLIVGDAQDHDAHRRLCGSLLFSQVQAGAFAHVAVGTLVDVPSIRPSEHIFVGSKAPWFTITDHLPQHERFP